MEKVIPQQGMGENMSQQMIHYYTAIVMLSCLVLCVLSILVYENGRMLKSTKNRFYETYVLVILVTLAEWASVVLNGAPAWTMGIHRIVKCMDYTLTPVAGYYFARQLQEEYAGSIKNWVLAVLSANAVLEMISIYTGWTFYLDANNVYHHGPLYFVYAVIFCIVILYVLLAFYTYSRNFKNNNSISLFAIMTLVCMGIGIQELIGGGLRTSCFSLAFGAVLLFIHYNEFLQQQKDDDLSYQKQLLEKDAMTGLGSRYAYIEALQFYDRQEVLPQNFVVFSVDVNGLKVVNDTLGHEAGDEIICGAAFCIETVLGPYGQCFRTGGDEFVALLDRLQGQQANEVQKQLRAAVDAWRGEKVDNLRIASGYAAAEEHPDLTVEKLVHVADTMMYADKERYYQKAGCCRREQMKGTCACMQDCLEKTL